MDLILHGTSPVLSGHAIQGVPAEMQRADPPGHYGCGLSFIHRHGLWYRGKVASLCSRLRKEKGDLGGKRCTKITLMVPRSAVKQTCLILHLARVMALKFKEDLSKPSPSLRLVCLDILMLLKQL